MAEADDVDDFWTHEDYPKLVAGAHRRRVTPIDSPALTRHLVFWYPLVPTIDKEYLESIEASDDLEEKRAEAFDHAIATVYGEMRDQEDDIVDVIGSRSEISYEGEPHTVLFRGVMRNSNSIVISPPLGIDPDPYRAIAFDLLWRGIRTTMSFELHTEFLTVNIILDFSKKRTAEQSKMASGEAVDEVVASLRRIAAATKRLDKDPACETYHDILYKKCWAQFEKDLLKGFARIQKSRSLGAKIIDFRGLIVGAKRGLGSVFTPPFSKKGQTGLAEKHDQQLRIERVRRRKAACSVEKFERLWPLLRCRFDKDTEFTVSKLMVDRAIFATALGEQTSVKKKSHKYPLFYLIFEDAITDWQLGRLIYRQHRAGTARVSAAMYYWDIRKASGKLSVAEELLKAAFEAQAVAGGERKDEVPAVAGGRGKDEKTPSARPGNGGVAEDIEKARTYLRTALRKVDEQLQEIADLFPEGTIEARIERSRYYVTHFKRVTDALRIERYPGYQPYTEFVEQRLGPVFDTIDRTGRRFERVQRGRELLARRLQVIETIYLEEVIARTQNSMSETQRKIAFAQEYADIALFCVLGPYYIGSIVLSAWAEHLPSPLIWWTAFYFGVLMFGFIMSERKIRGRGLRWRLLSAFLALILSALLSLGTQKLISGQWVPETEARPAVAAGH